jgi:HEPN domain-containing protein/predicted nucleotidyltransferase
MTKKRTAPERYIQPYRYPSPDIPMSAIRRFVRQIAKRFRPEKIILFGSYAYGTPHEESDVDLLVVMATYNPIAQSVRISLAFERPFSLDLIVRTPKQIARGLREDDSDWFLREVVEKGIVLYEAPHRPVGSQGRGGHGSRKKPGRQGKTPRDAACFHCQQAAEKYLKALLQECGLAVPRTHDLEDLLDLLLRRDATLGPLRRGLASLTRFAVEYRYPGLRARTREMYSALRHAERVRAEMRSRLGLSV